MKTAIVIATWMFALALMPTVHQQSWWDIFFPPVANPSVHQN